jgi:hypothetical protein
MQVPSGSTLIKYGLLELDTLNIPGGNVMCLPPGNVILTFNGFLSNGGTMSITCGFQVGPWFQCSLPEYGYLSINEPINSNLLFKVFPNPAKETLTIELKEGISSIDSFRIINVLGKTVIELSDLDLCPINISHLLPSIYFVQLIKQGKIFQEKLIID